MRSKRAIFSVRLFYSYCHKDAQHRADMEKSLAMLKTNGCLEDWSDRSILPGERISEKIRTEMNEVDIMAFLPSPDFLASEECQNEWRYAKSLSERKLLFRIPVILKDCAWKDLLNSDDVKALPKDGKPVTKFNNRDTAWQEVYDGIKAVVNVLRNTFTVKPEFVNDLEETGLISQQRIKAQDIFVFPRLSYQTPRMIDGGAQEKTIETMERLLEKKLVVIHGEEMSGKTTLVNHVFLSLIGELRPVLHLDLQQMPKISRNKENVLHETYKREFNGDYSLWKKKNDKILVLDNLSPKPHHLDFVVFCREFFDRIIIAVSSDIFNSFFRDEKRLADFCTIKIEPLTHKQQEKLIRKRLALVNRINSITDGFIDQVEDRVNAIIISNKIVPRYPFYVLSILQTYEGYMPNNISITSYGHCYYVLILANLVKAEISRNDSAINACMNFAENLAFYIYSDTGRSDAPNVFDFSKFVEKYNQKFTISNSLLNRLRNQDYGIIAEDGRFRTTYMYYFFLGRFLSKIGAIHQNLIQKMCNESHLVSNHLTLLFIIHHTDDNDIIDNILLGTMCTLENVPVVRLDRDETKKYEALLGSLRPTVLSDSSVEAEREKQREARDHYDHQTNTEGEAGIEEDAVGQFVNDCYRIFKNNTIMGQILRNKYGSLERTKIKEIIEIIADSGLRLINSVLRDEKEITDHARYLHDQHPEDDIAHIKNLLRLLSFLWTDLNIDKIVNAINRPELRQIVDEVVHTRATPAYDIIGYFSRLDSAEELSPSIRTHLSKLLKKYNDRFLRTVLSMRTRHYINTHRSEVSLEQAVCSLLDIKYRPRLR